MHINTQPSLQNAAPKVPYSPPKLEQHPNFKLLTGGTSFGIGANVNPFDFDLENQ